MVLVMICLKKNFDADFATNETVEQDWKERLLRLADARGQTSTTSDEEDDDDNSVATPIVSAGTAMRYLNELIHCSCSSTCRAVIHQ